MTFIVECNFHLKIVARMQLEAPLETLCEAIVGLYCPSSLLSVNALSQKTHWCFCPLINNSMRLIKNFLQHVFWRFLPWCDRHAHV